MDRLAKLGSQIADALSKQLPGKALSSLNIFVLDESVVHVNVFEVDSGVSTPAYSQYFGVSNLETATSQAPVNATVPNLNSTVPNPYIVSVLLVSGGILVGVAVFVMRRRLR